MNDTKLRILKLSNGDLILGEAEMLNEQEVQVLNPYTVEDFGQGPCVIPYMLRLLMEPMKDITLRMFDVSWSKNLLEFPQVHQQYISATTGIETTPEEQIII